MKIQSVVCDFIETYFNKYIGSRVFLGFSCGIPFLLRLTILDVWLKENNVSNTTIALLSLLQWPYMLKFLWAPFIEKIPFPFFSKIFGHNRGWALASHLLLFLGIIGMSLCDPQKHLIILMCVTSLVAFADGCQDVALYAYQIDRVKTESLGPVAGVFVFGYRVGMFFSKSIALYLAYYCGWNIAYLLMAFSVCICTFFVMCIDEPNPPAGVNRLQHKSMENILVIIKDTISECLYNPFKKFIMQSGSEKTMAIIVLFMFGDRMLQKMSKLFYIDLGFSLLEIANVVQVFGTVSSIIGGLAGGYCVKILGVKRSMFYTGIIHAITCFLYIVLAHTGHNINVLYFVVFVENVTAGAMMTSFISFLYSLCRKQYASTQYALLWGFYEMGGAVSRTISGWLADTLGWVNFFIFVPIIFIPSLVILKNIIHTEPNENNLL